VRIEPGSRIVELSVGERARVRDLLKRLGLSPEEVVVLRGGELLVDRDEVCESDEVVVIEVFSVG